MDIHNLKSILLLAKEPENIEEFNFWIKQEDIFSFLSNEISEEYIILYASLPDVFIHAVLMPHADYNKTDIDDLLQWSYDPYSSWSQVCSSENVWVETPLSGARSKNLEKGEQIIFARSFEGVKSKLHYYEINQKISHLLNIHFMSERNAWCRLNQFGDIEEAVKIIENIKNLDKNDTSVLIAIKKTLLGEYAGVTNSILIRMFDFTRCKSQNFSGWHNINETKFERNNDIFGRLAITANASYSRGIQLADIRVSHDEIYKRLRGESESQKRFVEFIAHDWKNKIIVPISCNPSCLANYFTESKLPYEITPAFFRPEVLSKYKSDREKYKLRDRSISCRGSWHLETFDVNEAGQVHTYLIYLSRLPYEEQLHWKIYNEKPKGTISDRALKTDFEGQFYEKYNPLQSLKRKLQMLDDLKVEWWQLRNSNVIDNVQYPYTNSENEWGDEILNLDQLLIEGFEEKWLRKKAKTLGKIPDQRFRSIKLIEECLIAMNFEKDYAENIIKPFQELNKIRNKIKAHASDGQAAKIIKHSLNQFGSLLKHFESLCAECDEALETITATFACFK